jgi:hypothetical protein
VIGLERDILSLSSYGVCQIIFGRGGWFDRKNDKLLPFRILKEELRMRKVLSIVLVLALVLGSTAFSFGALPSDVKGTKYEDAVNVLMDLDVISGYPDGSYKPAGIVTRGEMAKIIICALGLEDYAAGASSFKDMAGHWSDKYVAYAVSLGIINGYPDGTFKPDNTVTYDEAAKMLVAALGYTEEALVGTWPANWVTKARVLGILDGVKAGATGANRGDIALMAFQTLNQQIGKTNKDGDFVATNVGTLAVPEDDTMLRRLGAELYLAGAAFVVTDTLADDAIANIREYIGAYVTAYSSDGDIMAIKEVKSTFLTGDLNAAGTKFDTGDVEYDVVDGAYYVTNGDDVTNGESTVNGAITGVWAADKPAAGTYTFAVDVSGKKIKDIYSIGTWAVDDDFMFEDGDLEDDNIAGNLFKLDDNDDIDMNSFALLGVSNLEDIEEDNVVYVYLGATSSEITRIEVGTETASGKVSRIKGGSEYTIGGKVYEFSAETGAITTRPAVGDEIDIVLDYAGDIYDYETVSGESGLYGIVLRTSVASEDMNALDAKDAKLELFLADGTKKEFVIDYDEIGTAAADGIKEGAAAGAVYDFNGGSPDTWKLRAGDLIEYALNKDGEIKEIEWMVDAQGTTAVRADTTRVVGAADLSAKGYYQTYQVTSDALILTYDAAFTTDADDYGVADRAKLLDSSIPTNAYYVLDGGKIVLMYINDAATSADDVFGVLVDAEENDSDAGWGVDMLIDGKEVFFNSNIDATGLVKDILYLVEYDVDGDVSALTAQNTLDPTTPEDFYASARTNVTSVAGTCTISGYVIKLDTAGDTFDIDGAGSARKAITLDNDVAVYKWSDADGYYKLAKISDIKGKVEVAFFDTVDDDGVFDVVLIMDDAAAPAY